MPFRSRYTGLIEAYRDRLPVHDDTRIISLGEGNTPLIKLNNIPNHIGKDVDIYVKYEGLNPTGSFKDRGMTMAVTKAVEEGSKAIICASTGNTSAAAAAYAARAGITAFVLIPDGKIALGKLAQAMMHGAVVIQIKGNFDDGMRLVKEVAEEAPVTIVNSINPYRLQGQKTAAFESEAREMKTEIALKNDEIRDLRLVELKDAEDAVAALTADLETSRADARDADAKSKKLIEKLSAENEAKLEKMSRDSDIAISRIQRDADVSIQQRDNAHKKEVAALKESLGSTMKSLKATEHTLSERSTLLSEMVEHNKGLESKLEKMQAQVTSMGDERKREKKVIETTKKSLAEAREKLLTRENTIKKKLTDETMLRESAEKSLSKMKKQYIEAMKVKKLVGDLQKENGALKDKIGRQEAYLQRKLQKDKVMRERMSPVASTPPKQKATPADGTQARQKLTPRRLHVPATRPSSSAQSVSSDASSRLRYGSRLQTPSKYKGGTKIPDWELEVE